MEKRFTTKNTDNEEFDLVVVKPDTKQLLEAEKVYKKSFRQALEEGAMLRKKLGQYMQEQGIWTEEQEETYVSVVKDINLLDYQLNKGQDSDGKKLKISKAKQMALDLRDKRVEFRELISERQDLDHLTAEGQSDTERFSYLVFVCTKDFLTNKPYYSSFQDYQEKGNEQASVDAAKHVGEIVYEIDPDYDNSLTENRFLKRFKFVNEENQLIDTEGNFIDRDGNPLDKEGYMLNEEGKRININDLPILEDSETVEKVEFEDDLGVLTVKEAKPPKRKRAVVKEV
tara:strand:- start:1473 stop:2327 length:855 start_codon:yes stop_codon:yes gene_type:complete